MKFFDRLSNGWKLGMMSLNVIKDKPTLMLFPAASGFAMILLTLSFLGGGWFLFGDQIPEIMDETTTGSGDILAYISLFLFYLCNYFIVVFFNVGLVYCARKIMDGQEVTVGEGLSYAQTRVGTILAWAALAATVGMIIKTIQERVGTVGQIITGIIGMVWNIATFFVVPVIAYEDVSPIEAVKRSGQIVKDKWGESIGSNISFGVFTLIGIFLIALPLGFISGYLIHPLAGVIIGFVTFLLVNIATSAGKMIFLTAAYNHATEGKTGDFDSRLLDDVFISK